MLSRKRKSPGLFSLALWLLLIVGLACVALTAGARLIGLRQPPGVLTYTGPGRYQNSDIYAVDVQRVHRLNLTRSAAKSGASGGVWSADGTKLAYARFTAEDESQVCVLGRLNFCYPMASQAVTSLCWSPDGRWLAYMDGKMGLLVRNVEQGTLREYRSKTPGYELLFDPAWSPNSAQIAFALNNASSRSGSLYLTSPDLTKLYPLYTSDKLVKQPAWSPDGQYIAFISARDDLHGSIYVMDAQGGTQRQLTQGDREGNFWWSPDGQHLIFTSSWDGVPKLYQIDADGTNQRELTHGEPLGGPPVL